MIKRLDVKIPTSTEIKSGCILSEKDIEDLKEILKFSGMKKGSYMAMLIKRDIKQRKEKGII
jgi:hypothetical protein